MTLVLHRKDEGSSIDFPLIGDHGGRKRITFTWSSLDFGLLTGQLRELQDSVLIGQVLYQDQDRTSVHRSNSHSSVSLLRTISRIRDQTCKTLEELRFYPDLIFL